MREKPILFNTDMVKAILDGKKTVTRRIIRPQPEARLCYAFAGSRGMPGTWGYPAKNTHESWGEEYRLPEKLAEPDRRWTPPCRADDLLWVRETWKQYTTGTAGPGLIDGYLYKADEPQDTSGMMVEGRWHPSIHMPKEAARIWLKVKNVKVQRLQEMTSFDAYKEGFRNGDNGDMMQFMRTWESTIRPEDQKSYGWQADPWVWVIEFERTER